MPFFDQQALLADDADTWSPLTYRNAKQQVLAMRDAGVSERDADMQRLLREIERFHRSHFEQVNCGIDLGLYA